MSSPIRVVVLGTGRMGLGISRLLQAKPGFDLVGAYARRGERAGRDLGEVMGLGTGLGIEIGNDVPRLVEQCRPDVAVQATCSTLDEARREIDILLSSGVAVVSIAEEMAFPAAVSPTAARELHELALANRVAVLGTGINPGFVLDLLVITLSGVCTDIDSITATRVNDLAPYGPTVLRAQGVGLSTEAFAEGLEDGSVVGHIGFAASIQMLGAALAWEFDRIEETREPIVANVARETEWVRVEAGMVAGCLHTAVAYRDGRAVVTLTHPQQLAPHLDGVETEDVIEIRGTPSFKLSTKPELPGGESTVALAVNMIPKVLNAPPGLYAMPDLPAPAAILGDVRHLIRAPGTGS